MIVTDRTYQMICDHTQIIIIDGNPVMIIDQAQIIVHGPIHNLNYNFVDCHTT